MLRKVPIGTSDFRKLRERNYYYVDKSLLIQEILDASAEILNLTCPRRFGKTVNLSMLRNFFEQPGNPELFTGLAIAQKPEAMELQGRYPVIFLTFKDIKQNSYDDCFQQMQSVLAAEYRRHEALLKGGVLREEELEYFRQILKEAATRSQTERSLKLLTEFLHRATGQKVILLIDEYDTPIQAAYTYGYYEEAILFARNLLGAVLKDNAFLEKGVLTGILRVARESLFSGLNNVAVFTVLSPEFSDKFGFTRGKPNACFWTWAEVPACPQRVSGTTVICSVKQ